MEETVFVAVDSSFVAALSYEESDAGGRLYVRMKAGRTYLYEGVAQHVYESMLAAESKGTFYNRWVKGHYPERQVL